MDQVKSILSGQWISDDVLYLIFGQSILYHLIGYVTVLFSWSLLPLVYLLGYLATVSVSTAVDDDQIPKFRDPLRMLRFGGIMAVALTFYMSLFVVFPLMVTMSIVYYWIGPEAIVTADWVAILIFTIFILGIVVTITALPVAAIVYNLTGSFKQLYNVMYLLSFIWKAGGYSAIGMYYSVFFLSFLAIVGVLTIVPDIGIFLLPLLIFWTCVASVRLYTSTIDISALNIDA